MNTLKKPAGIVLVVVIIGSAILAILSYQLVMHSPGQPRAAVNPTVTRHVTPTPKVDPTATAIPTATPILLPTQDPSSIAGIEGSPDTPYPGIPWVRIAYPTCGSSNLRGDVLRNAVQKYHSQGIRVLLTLCQPPNITDTASDTTLLNDAAQGNPDAVQCGNEEMKQDPSVSFLYVQPSDFAKFYDLCEHTMHSVRSDIPVLLGSLDPHVAGPDYQLMVDQANYLDQMQNAMNTSVHPGGNWDWHNQTLGLIDSWHNGYEGANNLSGLFSFWAQQFHVDLNSGQLGKHLWVVEGTGCFKGCGVDENSAAQEAIAHILALTTDVQTVQQYKVPFFYFSGKDFQDQGIYWPIGILTPDGKPKPIRQDLAMGAVTLSLSCSGGNASVTDQEQLLAKLYSHCTLPSNYVDVISNA